MIRIKVEAYSVMFKRTKDSYGCLIENCSGWNMIRCFNSICWLPNHQIYSVTNEGIMISYQGWSISDKYKFFSIAWLQTIEVICTWLGVSFLICYFYLVVEKSNKYVSYVKGRNRFLIYDESNNTYINWHHKCSFDWLCVLIIIALGTWVLHKSI